MIVRENLRLPAPPVGDEMDFQIAALQDACAKADRYWCNWLWNRAQPPFGPSEELMRAFPGRSHEAIEMAWGSWFDVLTSWEYADALIGCDVRRLLGDFATR